MIQTQWLLTNFYYYVSPIRDVTFSGGLVISSSGGHNYYNGNGSLPRHALQQSYVYKPNPEQGGPMTSGLATRVWRQQSNVPYHTLGPTYKSSSSSSSLSHV